MEIKILKDEKDYLEVEIGNLTVAEVLRVYLNDEGADLAVWKRDHPSQNPILILKNKDAKKTLKKAIETVDKEIDNFLKEFKKI